MKIGVIGSGYIGGTLAKLWAQAGHQILLSNSRGPASLAALVAEIGQQACPVTVDEAAAFGDVVLAAIPFGKYQALPAEPLAGKIVIDAMNYYPARDGQIDVSGLTSSELVARHLAQSPVVKAFNTMNYRPLGTEGRPGAPRAEQLALYVAGDDAEAKAVVMGLIEEIGFAAIDTGSLHEGGRKQEPGSPIYNRPVKVAEAEELLARAW